MPFVPGPPYEIILYMEYVHFFLIFDIQLKQEQVNANWLLTGDFILPDKSVMFAEILVL